MMVTMCEYHKWRILINSILGQFELNLVELKTILKENSKKIMNINGTLLDRLGNVAKKQGDILSNRLEYIESKTCFRQYRRENHQCIRTDKRGLQ